MLMGWPCEAGHAQKSLWVRRSASPNSSCGLVVDRVWGDQCCLFGISWPVSFFHITKIYGGLVLRKLLNHEFIFHIEK